MIADIVVRAGGYWGDTAETHVAGTNPDAEAARSMLLDILEQARTELVPGATGAEVFANIHSRVVDRAAGRRAAPPRRARGRADSFEDPHLIPSDTMPLRALDGDRGRAGRLLPGPLRGAGREHLRRSHPTAASSCGTAIAARPCVSRAHHTGYTVSDLDRSLVFYRDLLGCEVIATQEKEGGYLAAIVGYPDAHVRMAHLRVPGGEHVIELFEYLSPTAAGRRRAA